MHNGMNEAIRALILQRILGDNHLRLPTLYDSTCQHLSTDFLKKGPRSILKIIVCKNSAFMITEILKLTSIDSIRTCLHRLILLKI